MTAILSPTASFISFSADFQTITIDKTQIVLPTDIGIHNFSIAINSVDFPLDVSPLTLPFVVDI